MAADLQSAAAALEEYAGLDAQGAGSLVDAVTKGVVQEALELMAGDAPVPSSLADARALRLRYITMALGRALRPREVEVILRISPSGALSVLRRLNATYPRTVDGLLRDVVAHTATVTPTGNQKDGFRWEVYFDEPVGLEYAYQLMQRRGLTHNVRVRRQEQTLDTPREVAGQQVLDVLGIPKP